MKHKKIILIIGLFIFLAFVVIAKAQLNVEIDVKDAPYGNSISGQTISPNTEVFIHGYYEDLSGSAPAKAQMDVYYDDGTGLIFKERIFDGTIGDASTTIKGYTLTEIGTYEFKWTCTKEGTTSRATLACRLERGMDRDTVFVISEPGVIAILLSSLLALGLLALKRTRK